MYHVSGGADDDFYCPCCEGIEELETTMAESSASDMTYTAGASLSAGPLSVSLEATGTSAQWSDLSNTISNAVSDWWGTTPDISGAPIR